jgi:ABC-type multidrug transport system fused ATPase/permease subunit
MARDAPVLVLDEPTVGLDAALESVLLAAFDAVAEGRTTVVVSHQLAGLRNADRIAVLSNGVIAESGTHDQLLAARRTYWRLDRLQRGEPDSVPAAGARAPAGQRASDPRRQTTGAS